MEPHPLGGDPSDAAPPDRAAQMTPEPLESPGLWDAEPPIEFDDHPAPSPWSFATFGRWEKPVVTWRVDSASPGIDLEDLRAAVGRAADAWTNASELVLREGSANDKVDIVITAEQPGPHGDQCPFDATTLAHAFFPGDTDPVCPRGKIHINSGQSMTLDPRSGRRPPYDLESILLHELGHALGLGHSSDPEAVMWSQYSGTRRAPALDDISGMIALYPPDQTAPGDGRTSPGLSPWLSPPAWEPPRCVKDAEPQELCFESRGLVGRRARVTILEWDKSDVNAVGWIDVMITPEDVADGEVAVTCVEWTARWEPDGPGSPEFVAQVVVEGQPSSVMPPLEEEALHVGKGVRPCAF